MAEDDAAPLTVDELWELSRLQLAARGETQGDVHRKLRAELERLRAGVSPPRGPVAPVPLSVPELKEEVTRLKEQLRMIEEAIKDLNG